MNPRRYLRQGMIVLGLILAGVVPGSAFAAEIYGRVWDGSSNRPLVGASMVTDCSDGETTDRYGLYRLQVSKTDIECNLSLIYRDKESTSLRIYVTSRRTLVDIEVRPGRERWVLVRR